MPYLSTATHLRTILTSSLSLIIFLSFTLKAQEQEELTQTPEMSGEEATENSEGEEEEKEEENTQELQEPESSSAQSSPIEEKAETLEEGPPVTEEQGELLEEETPLENTPTMEEENEEAQPTTLPPLNPPLHPPPPLELLPISASSGAEYLDLAELEEKEPKSSTKVTYKARGHYFNHSYSTDHHRLSGTYLGLNSVSGFKIPYASLAVEQILAPDLSVKTSLATSHYMSSYHHHHLDVEHLYLFLDRKDWQLDFYLGRFSSTTGGLQQNQGFFHIYQLTPSRFEIFSSVDGIKSNWHSRLGNFTFSVTKGQTYLRDDEELASIFSYPLAGVRYQLGAEGLLFQASYHFRRSLGAYAYRDAYEALEKINNPPTTYGPHITSYLSYGVGFFRGAIEASVDFHKYAVTPVPKGQKSFNYTENMVVLDAAYLAFPWKPFIHASTNTMSERKALSHMQDDVKVWGLGTHYYISKNIAYYVFYSLSKSEALPTIFQEDVGHIKEPYHRRTHTVRLGVKVSGGF